MYVCTHVCVYVCVRSCVYVSTRVCVFVCVRRVHIHGAPVDNAAHDESLWGGYD